MSVHRELLRGGHAPAERRHESVVPKLDLSHRIIRHTRKTKKSKFECLHTQVVLVLFCYSMLTSRSNLTPIRFFLNPS